LGNKRAKYSHPAFWHGPRPGSIEKARAGIYPQNIAADVSPERLRRFFVKVEGGIELTKRSAILAFFARQNLLQDPPFSSDRFISCRNVLIYLGPVMQKRIMAHLSTP